MAKLNCVSYTLRSMALTWMRRRHHIKAIKWERVCLDVQGGLSEILGWIPFGSGRDSGRDDWI